MISLEISVFASLLSSHINKHKIQAISISNELNSNVDDYQIDQTKEQEQGKDRRNAFKYG